MAQEFFLDGEIVEPLDRYRQGTVALVRLATGEELQAFIPTWRLARGDRVRGHYRKARRYATPVNPEAVEVQPGKADTFQRELGQAILNALPGFGYRRALNLANLGVDAFVYLKGEQPIERFFDNAEHRALEECKEALKSWRWYFSRLEGLVRQGFTPLEGAAALEEIGANAETLAQENPFLLVQCRGIRYHALVQRFQRTSAMGALLEEIKTQIFSQGDTLIPLSAIPLSEEEKEQGLREAGINLFHKGGYASLLRLRSLELSLLDNIDGESSIPSLQAPKELSSEQAAAFSLVKHRIAALTGGPGTGKTFTIGRLVATARQAGVKVSLIAPTGKAAQRMQEVAGVEAFTIHRALGINPSQPFPEPSPLPSGLVILDEASMVGLEELGWVLDALKDGSCLLLVGDADQLPPVSPGAPFSDLLGLVPTVALQAVRRQSEQSRIHRAARMVLAGEKLEDLISDQPSDLLYRKDNNETLLRHLVNTVRWYREQGFPLTDMQVLTPMHGGPLGTRNLGKVLRDIYRPDRKGRSLELGDGTLAGEGEKVIFNENQPRWGIMNGTVGTIADIGEDTFVLETSEGLISLPRHLARVASQGYAITVHRSQGSEWPVVILVLPEGPLTRRKLVYTAITRAKQQIIVLSEVDLNQPLPMERHRHTYLRYFKERLSRERAKEQTLAQVENANPPIA